MSDETNQEGIEAQLLAMANDVDSGKVADEIPEATEEAPRQEPEIETLKEEKSEPDKTDSGTEADKAKEPSKEEPKEEPKKPEEKKESNYDKAKKEAERKEKTWKQINEEKEALRKEREELQRIKDEAKKASEVKDQNGYTSKDYENAAEKFDADSLKAAEDGDIEEAKRQKAFAKQAMAKANELRKAESETQATESKQKFAQEWGRVCDEVCDEIPELLDKESPLAKEVDSLIKQERIFSMIPDGFKKAVEVAKLRQEAASVPELKSRVETLTKEIERLNQLTSLHKSNPSKPVVTKKFEDMEPSEMEQFLRQQADEADSRGVLLST